MCNMGVDKTIEIVYDLSSLNEEQAGKLVQANKGVIDKSTATGRRKKW